MVSIQEENLNNLLQILLQENQDYSELLEPIRKLSYEKKLDLVLGELKQLDQQNSLQKKKYYFLQRKLEKMSSITPFYINCREQYYLLNQVFDKNIDLHFQLQVIPQHIKYSEKKHIVQGLLENEGFNFKCNLDKESLINLLLQLPEDDPQQYKIKYKKATFYDKLIEQLHEPCSCIAVAHLILSASHLQDVLVEAGIASPFAGIIPLIKSVYYGFQDRIHLLIDPFSIQQGYQYLTSQLTHLHSSIIFSGKLLVIGNLISIGIILYSCYKLQKQLRTSQSIISQFYQKLLFYENEIKLIYSRVNNAISKIYTQNNNDAETQTYYDIFYQAMNDAKSIKESLNVITQQINNDILYMNTQISKSKRQKIYLIISGVASLGILIVFPPGGVFNILAGIGVLISAGEYFFTESQIQEITIFQKELNLTYEDVNRLVYDVDTLQEYITKNSQIICDNTL